MRILQSISLGIAAVALASPVQAGSCSDKAKTAVNALFETADENGDGALVRAEYDASGLARFGVAFDDYDADADGVTSLDEFRDLYDRHHPSQDDLEV